MAKIVGGSEYKNLRGIEYPPFVYGLQKTFTLSLSEISFLDIYYKRYIVVSSPSSTSPTISIYDYDGNYIWGKTISINTYSSVSKTFMINKDEVVIFVTTYGNYGTSPTLHHITSSGSDHISSLDSTYSIVSYPTIPNYKDYPMESTTIYFVCRETTSGYTYSSESSYYKIFSYDTSRHIVSSEYSLISNLSNSGCFISGTTGADGTAIFLYTIYTSSATFVGYEIASLSGNTSLSGLTSSINGTYIWYSCPAYDYKNSRYLIGVYSANTTSSTTSSPTAYYDVLEYSSSISSLSHNTTTVNPANSDGAGLVVINGGHYASVIDDYYLSKTFMNEYGEVITEGLFYDEYLYVCYYSSSVPYIKAQPAINASVNKLYITKSS